MGEYANLFVALASSTTPWQNKLQIKFFFNNIYHEQEKNDIACWFHLYS